MEDKEIAIAILQRIIGLQHENYALRALLDAVYSPEGVPYQWRQKLREMVNEQSLLPNGEGQIESFERLLDSHADHNSLVRKVHQYMKSLETPASPTSQ